MKIMFVCRSFHNMAGGIEKMATMLMKEMVLRGHDVSLLTWDGQDAVAFYDLDPRIDWLKLDLGTHHKKAGWKLRLQRMMKMRKLVKDAKPDVLIAFQHGTFLSARLYTMGLGLPVIAAEREAPSRFQYLKQEKWQGLVYQSFRLAKKITIQCESYRKDYPAYLRDRIVTISNPVFPANVYAEPEGKNVETKILLCLGRLSMQKNQTVLIKAFAYLHQKFPSWRLVFAGEGEDRKKLEILVQDLNLSSCVSLIGATKDIEKLLVSSHLFCLPSSWEGFPNAIAEALAHGLPVVGFAECAGTRDLVKTGFNGILAKGNDNPVSLAASLEKLMGDDELRTEMGRHAIASVQDFVPDRIFDQWDALFREVGPR